MKHKRIIMIGFIVLILGIIYSFKFLPNLQKEIQSHKKVNSYYTTAEMDGDFKSQKTQIADAIYQHVLETQPNLTQEQKDKAKQRILILTDDIELKGYTENGKLKHVTVYFDLDTVKLNKDEESFTYYMDTTAGWVQSIIVFS